MTFFVHRNGGPGTPISSAHQGVEVDGQIVSPMPDYCAEALADNNPELVAFLAPPVAAPVLDATTLAAALVAKGIIGQPDIAAAVAARAASVAAINVKAGT